MIIYFLRHGQAESQITTDEARALTAKGRSDTTAVLRTRVDGMKRVSQIWASPLIRAQQTAEIAQVFFPTVAIQTTALLIPEANPSLLLDWLAELPLLESNDAVLLVTHQPLVGTLVNRLCGKADHFYPMGTSSLAAIEVDVIAAGLGNVRWIEHAPE
ncbi:phosphohistidine phosphatase SixA [Cellvibrio sp. UBA7661]|uniref:phosphohistidine phosphatase SixA n=1 Tax=Cellvibrio sp. UBA7661 TaxID=1946311 RepID=UPI002F3568E1